MDINQFRVDKGGDPELIRNSEKSRFTNNPALVDDIISTDLEWRTARFNCNEANKQFSSVNKTIANAKKQGQDVEELLAQANQLKLKCLEASKLEAQLKHKLDTLMLNVGNIVHSSVPVSNDEVDNQVVRVWGEQFKNRIGLYTHDVLLHRIGGYDSERGASVAGHRGYFLTGIGVLLNNALISYALRFLAERNFKLIQTPFLMKKDVMAKAAQLSQFDDELYKIVDSTDEKYLIATSEQPIAALHMDEWIGEKNRLPILYGGFSTCFRKEAGAHGRDVAGIFRVHQFEKIEMFAITAPEDSWDMHEKLLQIAEEFYKSLQIHYRVINIVSGELNLAAAKKYDLECWFPGSQVYRELVSCSNCTDYQARRMNVRCGEKKLNKPQPFVHMLNSTLCATERTICCILENYQTDTGIAVPEVLLPYLSGFVNQDGIIQFLN